MPNPLNRLRAIREYVALPARARRAAREDWRNGLGQDPGVVPALDAAVQWCCLAQDRSASADGGVARHYGIIDGWAPSYPETTGYLIPTLLAESRERKDPALAARVRRMVDWLVHIQLEGGAFQAGVIGRVPVTPTTFNTGQILLGLAAAAGEWGTQYRPALRAAAQWLVDCQDRDGAWRRYASPLVIPGDKTYNTHIAWGLLEAARVDPGQGWEAAAHRNIQWALTQQIPNGWFENCCLDHPRWPLTHTVGYTLRGLVEWYRYAKDPLALEAIRRTSTGLLPAVRDDGFLAGRLDRDWQGKVSWACLTGSVQIAACWFLVADALEEPKLKAAASRLVRYVRRSIVVKGPENQRGGVKGAFPISGRYCRFQYPNWAAKFFIDAARMELAAGG